MISKDRIRIMVRLEKNNSRDNAKTRKVARYFKSDYVALALIRKFFLVTIAYAFLLGLIALGFVDYISENLNNFDYKSLLAEVIIGYIVVLAVYLIITIIVYNVKYRRAKKLQNAYEKDLRRLERLYAGEQQ